MDIIFMNSENRLILNLTNKRNLKRSDKYVALLNLSIYYTWKNIKELYKNNKCKISAPAWNHKIAWWMDHILCQVFKTILSIS